jgi:hypothetical protein
LCKRLVLLLTRNLLLPLWHCEILAPLLRRPVRK